MSDRDGGKVPIVYVWWGLNIGLGSFLVIYQGI